MYKTLHTCNLKSSSGFLMVHCHSSSRDLSLALSIFCPNSPPDCMHLSCTCISSLYHHSFILSFLLSLPHTDSPFPPILLSLLLLLLFLLLFLLLLLVSLIYRRRCAVHTHSTSDTPAPPRPATGLSYLCTVVYLHNPPTERRRGRARGMRQ